MQTIAKLTNGALILAIGAVHTVFGIVAASGLTAAPELGGRKLLSELVDAGLVDGVGTDALRMAFFWFMFFGFVLMMFGSLLRQLELSGRPLPASAGWQLALLSLGGVLMMPASGLWLALPVAWRITRASRRGRDLTADARVAISR